MVSYVLFKLKKKKKSQKLFRWVVAIDRDNSSSSLLFFFNRLRNEETRNVTQFGAGNVLIYISRLTKSLGCREYPFKKGIQ